MLLVQAHQHVLCASRETSCPLCRVDSRPITTHHPLSALPGKRYSMDGHAHAEQCTPQDMLIPDLWISVWQRLPEESDQHSFAATCRYACNAWWHCSCCSASGGHAQVHVQRSLAKAAGFMFYPCKPVHVRRHTAAPPACMPPPPWFAAPDIHAVPRATFLLHTPPT